MIHISRTLTGYASVITCDVCARTIADAGMAAALRAADGIAIHVHKGACHDRAEKHLARGGWMELIEHIEQLAANSNATSSEITA
jgi:hypothetical protein